MLKRTEVLISLAILLGVGLAIAAIIAFYHESGWSVAIGTAALLILSVVHDSSRGHLKLIHNLGTKGKVLIVLAGLASAGFIIAAVVTFARERDWPAKYFYAAAIIWLVVFIALRRRARRNQGQ